METNGQANGLKSKKKENGDTKDNLWSAILEEVQNTGNTKLPSNKNVLVLGDNETGKTTLIAKLQGVEDPKKGSALEYAYIDVRDEYRDDHTRLSVWVLDGDPGHTNLLKFALNEETFPHTLVILTVAMTTPWGILDQLQSWVSVLGDHIDKLDLTPEQRQQSKQAQVQKWLNYTEPGDELEALSPMKRSSRTLSDELDAEPDDALGDGVLTTNLALDMLVVITKTDYMSTLEKEHDYRDEHLDFMQQWIRRFCLQYGAALFYTSAKEDKNCDLLYKYLTHRIYGLPFRTPALIVEKDAVLIPAGWDSMKKISILYENLQTCKPDDYYRDVIVQPATRKSGCHREAEVSAEDEQTFLQRQLTALQAGAAPRADSPLRAAARPSTQLDGAKIGMAAGAPGNEGVLANFFNSLLYKKTGEISGAGRGETGAARSDAAAELDRLTRAKRAPPSPALHDPGSTDC
ncbi:cytoplasmic dynein 1 light intermediate chain 2 isoform X4 [Plutella xylostella]|uniref:cytoplasmic dynein 1 light intermediate chain 2 isoform X3 n=1 Tax=Plutella xylostella TaxID=51655 RepID=UPI0020323581|nr:cytoplasmic dynein 1 light intermediate chain 2 isoform X3 [Plutella xylostella]XP_048482717.1 cytoplasmic dynein 1 light intermediate chain 2 isoform X4 [Plutella xylostella]